MLGGSSIGDKHANVNGIYTYTLSFYSSLPFIDATMTRLFFQTKRGAWGWATGGDRDLMSPVIAEQHYKNGMKKDPNGFMDIEWCSSTVLNNWDDLRAAFMAANAKKAIAPTQVRLSSSNS